MQLVKSILASFLLVAIPIPVAAQSPPATSRQFAAKTCRFQAKIPAGWRIKPSPSKKCVFSVVVPNRADLEVELIVRDGVLDDNQLGFTKEDGNWILQREDSAAAVQIESTNWVGLQGPVGSRIYEKFLPGLRRPNASLAV